MKGGYDELRLQLIAVRSTAMYNSCTPATMPSLLPKRGDGVHCGRSPHTEDS